ncbi:hypothetical protein [Helicobacter sp. 13S00401-1]|nr:hypothetical protein [Helicobacter sp. 13S00401-1]
MKILAKLAIIVGIVLIFNACGNKQDPYWGTPPKDASKPLI